MLHFQPSAGRCVLSFWRSGRRNTWRRGSIGHCLIPVLVATAFLASSEAQADVGVIEVEGGNDNDDNDDEVLAFEEDFDAELLLFEDIPIVVTAARRPQRLTQSSQAISVVSSDDVHYGGFRSLPDMLRFTPGVDVLQVDRNIVALGIRGMHDTFADRTKVLIDGRDVASPVFGGTDYFRLPIFPEDVARIEVVRGPGGAAWGANAFNGVINVITKEPEDVKGLMGSAHVNLFGDKATHARWADSVGRWHWRLALGHEERASSEDAIDGDDFSSRDFNEDWRVNGLLKYELSQATDLEFGSAYIHVDRGDIEFAGFPGPTDPRRDEELNVLHAHSRLEHEFAGGSSAYLQYSSKYEDIVRPSVWRYDVLENDFESQLNLELSDVNTLSVGGNVRWVHINADPRQPTDALPSDRADEAWVGLFAIDRWQVLDSLVLEGQLRGDYYSETDFDWSGRLSALHSLDESEQHVVRLSVAKAFRAPLYGIREITTQRVPLPAPPFPPGLFALNLLPARGLDNEQTYAAELGYSGAFPGGFLFSVDGYYQHYERLIGLVSSGAPLGAGVSSFQLDNLDGGDGFGVEAELKYRHDMFEVSTWYAHNNLDLEEPGQSMRAYFPARNKVGANIRFYFDFGLTLTTSYSFYDTSKKDPANITGRDARPHSRLDVSASQRFADDRAEIQVGVMDVFNDTEFSVSQLGSLTAHETPGRTYWLQLQLNFR